MVAIARLFLVAALGIGQSTAFVTQPWGQTNKFKSFLVKSSEGNWDGGVSANTGEDGKIKGCTITRVGSSLTEWTIQIDGEQADLGKFSEVVYKKLMIDAKQQRFQGFRPGTVPPHIEPTYRAFAMDEVAREAALEAMEQNNFRPFEDARSDLEITNVAIPPPAKKKKKKKKKKKGEEVETEEPVEEAPEWKSFETMKEAISAGWKPGQSFSFLAKNVKGQRDEERGKVDATTALGQRGSAGLQNNIAEAARLARGEGNL